jgi:hypothetical protein
MVMEDLKVKMEECSSRIDDPTYPEFKDIKHDAFFGVFFCYESEGLTC